MSFPFVSRARFEDLQHRLDEKNRELQELRKQHARVVDEINFRSTGFHIYPEFAASEQTDAPRVRPAPDPLNEQDKQPEEIFSTRMRTRLQSVEQKNLVDFEKRRKESTEITTSKKDAADLIEQALSEGDELAQQA